MKFRIPFLALLAGLLATAVTQAQTGEASAEHAVLNKDVGSWTAEATMIMPGMPEEKTTGEEVNTKLGEYWLVSNFSMDFMGAKFNGQGTFGYDADKKKYVGSWVDSMSPYAMHMEGTWDAGSRTMTMFSVGKDPTGVEKKGKSVTVTSADGNTRVFTMFDLVPDTKDEYVKSMEIKYTRKK